MWDGDLGWDGRREELMRQWPLTDRLQVPSNTAVRRFRPKSKPSAPTYEVEVEMKEPGFRRQALYPNISVDEVDTSFLLLPYHPGGCYTRPANGAASSVNPSVQLN